MAGRKKPLVVITRKLPDQVETRMRELFDAVAEIGDQLEVPAGAGNQPVVDPVGDGWHQHVGFLHRRRQRLARHRLVIDVQAGVEQLAHARFDRVGQFARDDDERLFLAGHSSLSAGLGFGLYPDPASDLFNQDRRNWKQAPAWLPV